MAEPRAASAADVAVSGHDVLLATKLHLPRPRPGFVPRPRLAVRLDEGPAQRAAGGLAVAGRGRQRPGAVLAPRGRRGGPGETGSRRTAAAPVRPAAAVVVRR